jgi:hypothetical protein
MAKKGSLNSPMESAIVKDTSDRGKAGDTMDRNPCPYFSEPHSMGPDTIRTVFMSGVDGKDYRGKIEGATTLNSPMQGNKTPSDPRK